MFTRWAAIPLVLIAGYFLYDTYQTGDNNLLFILPAVILLAVLFTLGPQINFWWSTMYPPKLEKPALDFLQKFSEFYRSLNEDQARKFRHRVVLIRMGKDFKSQAKDDLPEDIRLIFAANLAHLTFGLEEFLLPKYETVVIYPRPFPTPAYPEAFHASETFDEDGVLLYAAQQMLNGFTQPESYYNLGLHEQANALVRSHPNWNWPIVDDTIWEHLERISSFSRKGIFDWIGRPDVEPLPALIVHYLHFPARTLEVLPDLYGQLEKILDANGR